METQKQKNPTMKEMMDQYVNVLEKYAQMISQEDDNFLKEFLERVDINKIHKNNNNIDNVMNCLINTLKSTKSNKLKTSDNNCYTLWYNQTLDLYFITDNINIVIIDPVYKSQIQTNHNFTTTDDVMMNYFQNEFLRVKHFENY